MKVVYLLGLNGCPCVFRYGSGDEEDEAGLDDSANEDDSDAPSKQARKTAKSSSKDADGCGSSSPPPLPLALLRFGTSCSSRVVDGKEQRQGT